MDNAAEAIACARQARHEKDLPEARRGYLDAATIYRAQADWLAYAHCIRHVADIFREELNLNEAKALYEEALELYRNNLNTKIIDLANTVRPYALVQEKEGNLDAAQGLWIEARQLYKSLRLEPGVSECDAHIEKLSS